MKPDLHAADGKTRFYFSGPKLHSCSSEKAEGDLPPPARGCALLLTLEDTEVHVFVVLGKVVLKYLGFFTRSFV